MSCYCFTCIAKLILNNVPILKNTLLTLSLMMECKAFCKHKKIHYSITCNHCTNHREEEENHQVVWEP